MSARPPPDGRQRTALTQARHDCRRRAAQRHRHQRRIQYQTDRGTRAGSREHVPVGVAPARV